MNAFATAMAEEMARARAELWAAREREDESAVADAVDRLADLSEIVARVQEGPARSNA
jgi:hypothetical protein